MDFLKKPLSDFAAVRDGRNSMPLWLDIDLSNARSIASGTSEVINIAGNSFYVDADNTNTGAATLHFQDTNLGRSSAPFLATAGFVANVAFTQILIENSAQAGKRLRIFYGVDIDFRAGVNASVISGTVNIGNTPGNPAIVGLSALDYTTSYQSQTAAAALTPETIVLPANNLNGIIVVDAQIKTSSAAFPLAAFIAKASAPASIVDGDVVLSADGYANISTNLCSFGRLANPIKIPAGLGLYYISKPAEAAGYVHRNLKYLVL